MTPIVLTSHRWHISEEERVSFSPSRQGGSEEEVAEKKTSNYVFTQYNILGIKNS